MMNDGLAPDTYDKIRWAAIIYRCSKREQFRDFDVAYHKVNSNVFRQKMIENFDRSVASQLADFLKAFLIRGNRDALAVSLFEARHQTMKHLKPVAELSNLETVHLSIDDINAIERAFDHLKSIKWIGPTAASKILAVLNPGLFVMWDDKICKGYIPLRYPLGGRHYRSFLLSMLRAARKIQKDAIERGIEDPGKHLSETCHSVPNFTLAKFIDEWNYLTITREENYPFHPCGIQH